MSDKDKKNKGIVPLSHKGGTIIPAKKLEEERRQFETPAREVTLSEVFDYYRKADDKKKVRADTMLPIISSHSQLPSLLSKYNTLDEARARSGYQKTVEKMEQVVYEHLSFEKGFEKLKRTQERADPDYNLIKLLRVHLCGHFSNEEAEEVALDLSSFLTSEEMTWISVLESIPSMMMEHLLSSVPGIVDYFWDGVEWALDTLEYNKAGRERPMDTYEMAGLTGVRSDTEFSPFVPKVALAMRGLYLGLVSDAQIFDKVFEDLDSAALMSGDTKILRAFAARDGKALDDRYAMEVRGRINDFLSELAVINILKGRIMSAGDTVRLIGMLERMPSFFLDHRVVSMIPSGKGVMFLDPTTLEEIEYVLYDPFVGHIAQSEIYHGTNSVEREAPVWRLLFEKIRGHIRRKNLKEGNFTRLERLVKEIKDKHGIEVRSNIEKVEVPEKLLYFVTKKIDYTVKMGYWDLFCVYNILSEIPKKYLVGIKSIERRASGNIYNEMLHGIIHAGTFDRDTGALQLVIPPMKSNEQLGVSATRYSLTIAHEVGHSIYEQFEKEWKGFSKAGAKFPIHRRHEHFLTAYASTDVEEDFAESFACYYVFGDDFRSLAEKHPVLARKYAFVKKLFDGQEFEQRTEDLSIADVTGNIRYNFKLRLEAFKNEGQDPLAAAIMHRHQIEDLKSANKPIQGPQLIQKGAGRAKHKKGRKPHVRTFVEPREVVHKELVKLIGEDRADAVDANEIAEWILVGHLKHAAKELANMTGLSLKRCLPCITRCYAGIQGMQQEIDKTDEMIEEAEKETKDRRGEEGGKNA